MARISWIGAGLGGCLAREWALEDATLLAKVLLDLARAVAGDLPAGGPQQNGPVRPTVLTRPEVAVATMGPGG